MMNVLRYKAKLILWIIIIAFVFTIFAVWGMKATFLRDFEDTNIIAKIGKKKITYNEFGIAWQNKLQEIYDKNISLTDKEEKKLKKDLLNSLISRYLLLEYAKKSLNIFTTDLEVAQYIMSSPAFKVDGKFNKLQYLRILQYNRISPEKFEYQQKQEITLQKLKNFLLANVKISKEELKEYYLKRHRKIKIKYVYFNYKNYINEIKIDEEKMKDYYALHKKEFEKPERVKASHILIRADYSPTSPTGLTDDAAKKLAEDILKKIKNGESFSKLAKKYSQDSGTKDKGGDLGWFEKGMMVPEFEKAAFSLKKGEVSGIVKTKFGYHIIKCLDKEKGFEPTYEKVRKKILKKFQKEKGMKLAKKDIEKFKKEVNVNNFDKLAKKFKVKVIKTNSFTIDKIPKKINSEEFKSIIFDLQKNEISEIINGENGYYIAQIIDEKYTDFDKKKFEKEEYELKTRLKYIKFNEIYNDLIETLKKNAKIKIYENNL